MNDNLAHLDHSSIEQIHQTLVAARTDLVRDRVGAQIELNAIEAERETEWEEVAQEEQTADVLTRLSEQQYAQLRQIDGALERIDRGEFGTCIECGEPISEDRLLAQPWSPWCGDCAAAHEVVPVAQTGLPGDRPQDHAEDTPDPYADEQNAGSPLAPELEALDDAEVAETIREAFQTEVGEALDTVRVLCRDGVVILAGEVANETLPEIARRIVEDEVGYQVVDRLLVTDVAGEPGLESRRSTARAHQLPATAVEDDSESDLSEDVLEVEEEGMIFVPPTRPVPER